MTVNELIEELQEVPGDIEVGLEVTPSFDSYYGAYAKSVTHTVFGGEDEEFVSIVGDP